MGHCGAALAILGGAAPGGSAQADLFGPFTVVTTDAAAQTLVMANLPAAGDGVYYYGHVRAQQTNGQRGFRYNFWVDASRNAIGTNILTTGTIGPTGYVDVATPPWNTIGVPAGWGVVEANVVGNQIQVVFGGAAGQTVQWQLTFTRLLMNGATP